jgi:hypothetical protein
MIPMVSVACICLTDKFLSLFDSLPRQGIDLLYPFLDLIVIASCDVLLYLPPFFLKELKYLLRSRPRNSCEIEVLD